MRRVLAILLALTMMLSLTVSAAWADDPDPTPGTPVGTEEPANSDPAPANSGGGEETPATPGDETPATPGDETPAAPRERPSRSSTPTMYIPTSTMTRLRIKTAT